MDHKTFAKQCDETMAVINKLTASYHQLEKTESARGSEDRPFSDYVHKAAQLVGANRSARRSVEDFIEIPRIGNMKTLPSSK